MGVYAEANARREGKTRSSTKHFLTVTRAMGMEKTSPSLTLMASGLTSPALKLLLIEGLIKQLFRTQNINSEKHLGSPRRHQVLLLKINWINHCFFSQTLDHSEYKTPEIKRHQQRHFWRRSHEIRSADFRFTHGGTEGTGRLLSHAQLTDCPCVVAKLPMSIRTKITDYISKAILVFLY